MCMRVCACVCVCVGGGGLHNRALACDVLLHITEKKSFFFAGGLHNRALACDDLLHITKKNIFFLQGSCRTGLLLVTSCFSSILGEGASVDVRPPPKTHSPVYKCICV
jgi:hypothetical protein